MYLALADNSPAYLGANTPPAKLLEYMVQVPTEDGGVIWVREDMLDELSDQELYMLLQQQPHLSGIKDMFGRMRARKQDRKAERGIKRTERKAGRRKFFSGIVDKVGGIIGGVTGRDEMQTRGDFFPQITGGASVGVAKPWQNPLVIGLGLTLIVVAGVVMAKRSKK